MYIARIEWHSLIIPNHLVARKHAQKDVIQTSRATGKTLSLGDKMTFSPMHRLRHSPVSNADARSTAYLDLATSRHNVPSRRKHVVFQHPNKNTLVQAPHHMKRSPSGSANASPVERQRPDENARPSNKKSPPAQSDSKKVRVVVIMIFLREGTANLFIMSIAESIIRHYSSTLQVA